MSTEPVTIELLQSIPLFSSLTAHECEPIAKVATIMDFEAHEIILRQGRTSQNLWAVLEGTCEVVFQETPKSTNQPSHDVVLAELTPLQTFGEMSFFHQATHSANVRAKSKVKLLRLERAKYDGLVADGCTGPLKLALNTVSTLAERLRRMDGWVAELLNATSSKHDEPDEWSQFRKKLLGGLDIV